MRILITGAGGFIGSHLVEEFYPHHNVTAMLLPGERLRTNTPVKIVRADITKPRTLKKITGWPEIVIHCAGLTKAMDPGDYFRVNTEGTSNLLNTLSKGNGELKNFIFLSSIAAGGPAKNIDKPLTEDDDPQPIESYGQSKLEAEKILQESKIPTTILRLATVYGGGSSEYLLLMKLAAKRIRLVVDFDRVPFSLIHVNDLSNNISRIMQLGNGHKPLYYLSDGRFYNYEILSKTIADLFPGNHLKLKVPQRVLHLFGEMVDKFSKLAQKPSFLNAERVRILSLPFICSSHRFFSHYGMDEPLGLEEGLYESLRWYRREGWL